MEMSITYVESYTVCWYRYYFYLSIFAIFPLNFSSTHHFANISPTHQLIVSNFQRKRKEKKQFKRILKTYCKTSTMLLEMISYLVGLIKVYKYSKESMKKKMKKSNALNCVITFAKRFQRWFFETSSHSVETTTSVVRHLTWHFFPRFQWTLFTLLAVLFLNVAINELLTCFASGHNFTYIVLLIIFIITLIYNTVILVVILFVDGNT